MLSPSELLNSGTLAREKGASAESLVQKPIGFRRTKDANTNLRITESICSSQTRAERRASGPVVLRLDRTVVYGCSGLPCSGLPCSGLLLECGAFSCGALECCAGARSTCELPRGSPALCVLEREESCIGRTSLVSRALLECPEFGLEAAL